MPVKLTLVPCTLLVDDSSGLPEIGALHTWVGQVMYLSKHIMINRRTGKNKTVPAICLRNPTAVQSGIPMFFFPQGTRRIAKKLPFKDGAFRCSKQLQPFGPSTN
jgi:1-acyl-sn-glycerol-3-phosphate acyltransferase